jgi:hypothetical protein
MRSLIFFALHPAAENNLCGNPHLDRYFATAPFLLASKIEQSSNPVQHDLLYDIERPSFAILTFHF